MQLFTLEKTPADAPTGASAKKTKSRMTKAAIGKRLQKCADVIGPVQMGDTVHYATAGDWSMHDVLDHLLGLTGPAVVHAATWSITEDPVRRIVNALDAGRIERLYMLFDWRVRQRSPEAFAMARHKAAAIYATTCHAKVTTIINDDWHIAIIGSANYTNNPRIEAGVICADPAAADFHRGWIANTIDKLDPFDDGRDL